MNAFSDYLRPRDLAKVLDLDIETVYLKLQSKELPGFQIGNRWRTNPDVWANWLKEKEKEGS